MDDSFVTLGEYKAGCEGYFNKKKLDQFRLCSDNLVLLIQWL